MILSNLKSLAGKIAIALCITIGAKPHSPTPYVHQREPSTSPEQPSQGYKLLLKGQLKTLFRKHLRAYSEPSTNTAEEVGCWLLALYGLYKVSSHFKILYKPLLITLLGADALYAYSHYQPYKSLGYYPSLNHLGFPSISMLTAVGVLKLWKKIKVSYERTVNDRYKNMEEAALTNYNEIEIDPFFLQGLENQFLKLKQELIEQGLYNYLYLAGESIVQDFNKIDYHHSEPHEGINYQKAYKLINLTQKILIFVQA
jgi:hypothetical protein